MFISHTQCFVLHIVHSSARLHDYYNCLKKIAVGEGRGVLSGCLIQLTVDLEIAGGKKSPVFKKHFVPVAALVNNCIPCARRWYIFLSLYSSINLSILRVHKGSLAVIQRLVHDRELQLYDGTRLISEQKFKQLQQQLNLDNQQMESRKQDCVY